MRESAYRGYEETRMDILRQSMWTEKDRATMREMVVQQIAALHELDQSDFNEIQRCQYRSALANLHHFVNALDDADGLTRVTHIFRDSMQSTQAESGWLFDPVAVTALVLETIRAGFTGIEIGGGQSFQTALKRGRNPFKTIRAARDAADRETDDGAPFNLQMLLRGVNALGFRPYGRDVLRLLVQEHMQAGINIVRNFDALNDVENLELPFDPKNPADAEVMKRVHFQGAMCFTHYPDAPERYSDEYYLHLAEKMAKMGYRSLAIKDMSGQLTAERATRLIPELQKHGVPVYLHIHSTNFDASLKTLKAAVAAGVDGVELALAPLSGGASHHDIRQLLKDENLAHKVTYIDEAGVTSAEYTMAKHFTESGRTDLKLSAELRNQLCALGVPGGAIPFVVKDLEDNIARKISKRDGISPEAALVKAVEAFQSELTVVCRDAGYPPLVTPTADIICKQAIFNLVLEPRYTMLDQRFARLILGHYGEMVDHATGEVTRPAEALIRFVEDKRDEKTGAAAYGTRLTAHPANARTDELPTHQIKMGQLMLKLGAIATDFATPEQLMLFYALHPPGGKDDLVEKACLAAHERETTDILKRITALMPRGAYGVDAEFLRGDDARRLNLRILTEHGDAARQCAEKIINNPLAAKEEIQKFITTSMDNPDTNSVITRFKEADIQGRNNTMRKRPEKESNEYLHHRLTFLVGYFVDLIAYEKRDAVGLTDTPTYFAPHTSEHGRIHQFDRWLSNPEQHADMPKVDEVHAGTRTGALLGLAANRYWQQQENHDRLPSGEIYLAS